MMEHLLFYPEPEAMLSLSLRGESRSLTQMHWPITVKSQPKG
jgi:hypothetical protein